MNSEYIARAAIQKENESYYSNMGAFTSRNQSNRPSLPRLSESLFNQSPEIIPPNIMNNRFSKQKLKRSLQVSKISRKHLTLIQFVNY